MVWPYTTPRVAPFPEITQISTANDIHLPTVILTHNSLHLFDPQHHVTLSSHLRSQESIEKYGKNVSFKSNYQQDIIGIATDKGFLLIYSIIHNDEEPLSVYSKSSELLQNGLVLKHQLSFFEKLHIENPVSSYQLRFKIYLKIHHEFMDFLLLDKYEILLVTSKNLQLLDFLNSNDDIVRFEGLPIEKVIHEKPTDEKENSLFFAIDTEGKGRFYTKIATELKLYNDVVLDDVLDASINLSVGLILVLHMDRKTVSFFNHQLQSIVKKITFKEPIKSLKWIKTSRSFFILFENGTWALNSTFGSNYFKSTDFTDITTSWLSNVTSIDILIDQSYAILSDGSELFIISLLSNLSTLTFSVTNFNLKRPILVSNGEIHIYSGYENKTNNWNIIKVPFEEYHQLVQIYHASLSNDYKYLAVSNNKSLLIHSLIANDWSFYINDYNHDMKIQNLTWFEKLNLLIITNETIAQSELIIFDFKNFNSEITFDSTLIIFKYDFNSKIIQFNVCGEDILIVCEDLKYYHFKVEVLSKRGIKIDLVKITSFEKIFKPGTILQNVLKTHSESQDLLIQENNELIYLKHSNNTFEKFLLFDRVEYISKIDNENYYLFNGQSLIIIKNLSRMIQNIIDGSQSSQKSILKIEITNEYSPILLNLNNGLYISLENEIITKKKLQWNNILTKSSIFLHDLIKFEINNNGNNVMVIYEKYSRFKNFQYSLELLLYQSIETDTDDSNGSKSVFVSKLVQLIKHNPIYGLNIVSRCLRKIEINNWNNLLDKLELTSNDLINKSIELKQFKTLSILIIIFLNYNDQNTLISPKINKEKAASSISSPSPEAHSKESLIQKNKNTNGGMITDRVDSPGITEEYDEVKLLEILKLIYTNAKDEELWDSCFELLRFFKILDSSGSLLKKGIEMLEAV